MLRLNDSWHIIGSLAFDYLIFLPIFILLNPLYLFLFLRSYEVSLAKYKNKVEKEFWSLLRN